MDSKKTVLPGKLVASRKRPVPLNETLTESCKPSPSVASKKTHRNEIEIKEIRSSSPFNVSKVAAEVAGNSSSFIARTIPEDLRKQLVDLHGEGLQLYLPAHIAESATKGTEKKSSKHKPPSSEQMIKTDDEIQKLFKLYQPTPEAKLNAMKNHFGCDQSSLAKLKKLRRCASLTFLKIFLN